MTKKKSLLKKIFGVVTSIIPGGGIVKEIIAPEKSQQEKNDGLAMLVPLAQYNKTMARPRIAIGIVAVYLFGILIQWAQVLFKVAAANRIIIPSDLTEFAKIVVTVIVGTRGIEKIVGKIFKRKEK